MASVELENLEIGENVSSSKYSFLYILLQIINSILSKVNSHINITSCFLLEPGFFLTNVVFCLSYGNGSTEYKGVSAYMCLHCNSINQVASQPVKK